MYGGQIIFANSVTEPTEPAEPLPPVTIEQEEGDILWLAILGGIVAVGEGILIVFLVKKRRAAR